MSLILMYITNQLEVAMVAERYGVQRIWIDLETLGKEDRQRGRSTVISNHTIEDIRKIKPHLTTSELLVRINQWNDFSAEEIEAVIAAGADRIMLPMWHSPEEVQLFLRAVNGRCRTTLLLETREAVECLDEVLENGGMDEIYIGLNDLHLSYGMTFLFELLADGTVEKLVKQMAAYGIPYGFGGIASIGAGELPAENILLEHYRLGSTMAILSRSFCNTEIITEMDQVEAIFREKLKEIREFEEKASRISDFSANQAIVKETVARIVQRKLVQKKEQKKEQEVCI